MLELPEVITIQNQLKETILDKKVINTIANQSPHKFAFFHGDPEGYNGLLKNKQVTDIKNYGFYISVELEDTQLLFRDGANLRYHNDEFSIPSKHQLLIEFDDNTFLSVTISMYGGIWCCKKGDFDDNMYFSIAKNSLLPISDQFNQSYFNNLFLDCKPSMSSKAFIATEQRIIGIGNGVTQDILFNAKLHPKKKIETFTDENKNDLFNSIKGTLNEMILQSGRDTEKDLFDKPGKYKTILSKNTVGKPCPVCGDTIKKANFLGGSIYFCDTCQKL